MRLVRKVSRKRYYGKNVYETERIFVPVPAEYRDLVRPFLGRDMEISMDAEGEGFVMRVKPVNINMQ